MSDVLEPPVAEPKPAPSPWRATSWVCCGTIVGSILSCVVLAILRSEGLAQVDVTALRAEDEPRDVVLPLRPKTDALPDYEVVVVRTRGGDVALGMRPDSSAVDGLRWTIADPVPLAEIAGVRLVEKDHVGSDALVEVQPTAPSVTSGNWKFDFGTERSVAVGIVSFFTTPIGMAIAVAFFLAAFVLAIR